MKTIRKLLLLLVLLNFIPVAGQEKNWIKRFQKEGANFYEIRNDLSKKFKEKKKNQQVEITSTSNNIKIIGENDFIKFRRWEWYMSQNIHPDGTFPTLGELQQGFEDFTKKELSKTAKAAANWENISRTNNIGGNWGMGRTSAIGFHPTNANIFWVCAQSGGVWKTTDGGSSYIAQGDDLPYLGTGAIVVDYTNPDILYITTGDNTGGFGMGVYKSTNGGNSWSPTDFRIDLSFGIQFYNLVQSPTNPSVLLVATSLGIYRTANAGASWEPVASGRATDVAFKPDDGNIAYAIIDNKFYRSVNQGQSYLVDSDPNLSIHSGIGRISVTKNAPEWILTWSAAGIWANDGTTWSSKPKAIDFDGKITNFESMIFSPTNPDILFGGGVDVFTGNSTWTQISHNGGTASIPDVHADHRNMAYNPLNGRIYSCNDGGVDSYDENTKQWSRHSNGLVISQYYHAASSETNGNIIGVGSQDNGGAQRTSDLIWQNTNEADAGTQAIDPIDKNIRYTNYNPSPAIIKTMDGWQTRKEVYPTDVNESWWVLPYVLDPSNPQRIVAGYHAVYTSDDRGEMWQKISPNFTPSDQFYEVLRSIAVAPSDSNVIYTGAPKKLHYTHDNGKTWGSKVFSQDITSITVDPTDAKTVYITFGQYANGNKVFKSTDGGINWTNISAGIPNIPIYSIVYQKDSNELLYIGTQFGVFYKDKSMSSWQVYGARLPKTQVNHLHINYKHRKLRAATFGRGIYETTLLDETALTCQAPKNVTVTETTNNSITLNWDDEPLRVIHAIYYKKQSETGNNTETNITTNSYTLNNLEPNTTYDITVTVVCNNLSVLNADKITITTNNVCKATEDVKLVSAKYTSLSISWLTVPEIKNYYTFHKKQSESEWIYTFAPTNSMTFTNLEPNTIYDIAVGSACLDGTGKLASILSFRTLSNSELISDGIYEIKSALPGRRNLDVLAGGTTLGTNVQILEDNNTESQRWIAKNSNEEGYFLLSPQHASDKALDVSGGINANGTNVGLWVASSNNISQKWKIEDVGGSSFVTLTPKVAPQRRLEVSNASDANGSNVHIWENNNNTLAQQWIIEYIGQLGESQRQENPVKNENQIAKERAVVYPNPTAEQFSINFKQTSKELKNVHIELVNNLGVVVKKLNTDLLLNNGVIQVNTNQLATGMYTLVIKGDGGNKIHTQQILVRR